MYSVHVQCTCTVYSAYVYTIYVFDHCVSVHTFAYRLFRAEKNMIVHNYCKAYLRKSPPTVLCNVVQLSTYCVQCLHVCVVLSTYCVLCLCVVLSIQGSFLLVFNNSSEIGYKVNKQ